MKEIGIKDDGSILAMWNGNRGGATLVQKILNFMPVLVVVIVRKVPVIRGFFVPEDCGTQSHSIISDLRWVG